MPNRLWVSDFTYVSSWQGMVYVAFVIDVFAHKIVGSRVSTSMTTGFVLDALNHAICKRDLSGDLVHHSDRGSQYLSLRYTERLAEAGIDPSVTAWTTRMTTRWQKAQSACSKPKSSTSWARGNRLGRSNEKP